MNATERFNKTTELLSKFKNGNELYNKNITFNYAIQMMVNGMNEFDVIEQIVLQQEKTKQAFEDYVNRCSYNGIATI